MIDWKALLEKYMKNVIYNESVSYVPMYKDETFSQEEVDALKEIEAEIMK